jgi:acetyltransferase-like isoleucine patch superfamily enzyme
LSTETTPRLIAFYLPQFHPIPENDAWWGKGFTEWTSVTRARPLFAGHQQPRLPADLGFYDLRVPEVREAQAELARRHGIHGFCYYYYWFRDSVQLLDRPLREMLASGAPDFPFCLCWANENWTRRWDGREQEVLVAQDHSRENNLAFIRSIVPYLRDSRYIRVDGRPLLVVYRIALIPDLAQTVTAWREELARHGLPPPYLVAAESFDQSGAAAVAAGFDAACEFPPHRATPEAKVSARALGLDASFSGEVRDYAKIASGFRERALPDYPLHRGVTLAWDNTARRGNAAHVTVNFSVETYHAWLRAMVRSTRQAFTGERQLLFVNAWNEWSEGTYLEPDQLRGHACLEATRAALLDQPWAPHVAASPEPAVAPDALAPASASGAGAAAGGRLKLVAISMIGNEADVVEAFVRDNLDYVDHMLIAEHNSLDGTGDILRALVEEGLPLTVRRIEATAFAQAAVTNTLLAEAVERFDPDWVIPLDADEFLDAPGRAALEADLAALSGSHARLRWIQHVPSADDEAAEAHPARRIRHRYDYPPPDPEHNPYVWKLALNCRLIRPYLDRYDLEKGSHRVVFKGCREPSSQPAQILQHTVLRHYPVRSFEQLGLKGGLGLLQARLAGEQELGGTHVPRLHRQLLAGRQELADLQRAVREYLDTSRYTPDDLALTAVIVDAKQKASTLRHGRLRQPATVAFLRWIERQGATTMAGDAVPSAAANPARSTQATRFDWCPWLFWGEASEEARAGQLALQARWAAAGSLRCGARCYVSPQAGLVPGRVTLGDDCYIAAQAYVTDELTAGSHCTINPFAVVRGRVYMGDHVRVGAHASVLGFNHNHARLDRPIHEQGLSSRGIRIGDDVWIGSGALVLDGVSVGSHCIVAAGAVVTRDVPDWAVVTGNPARVLRDRRASAATRRPSLARMLADFGRRAAGQWPGIIARSEVRTGDEVGYTDIPGTPPASIRPLADAIEIAAAFGGLPPGQSAPTLIARLQASQDPVTGMPADPLAPPRAGYRAAQMNDDNTAYMVLSLGYALMCLGACFPQPFGVPQDMSPATLQALLAAQPWRHRAWGAGAWVDAVGTALWMNRHCFGLPGPAGTLFAWLQGACNPQTGLWGEPRADDGWLEPVNGFYRLTRGTYAQFERPVPYPEAALDTILAHIRANDGFETRNVNACNLLDVVHPLWLLSRSSAHRRDEVLAFVERQLPLMAGRWIDGAGFAFAPGEPAGLRGTEMWLSILAIGADALDMGDELPWTPRGVHRLRPPAAAHD